MIFDIGTGWASAGKVQRSIGFLQGGSPRSTACRASSSCLGPPYDCWAFRGSGVPPDAEDRLQSRAGSIAIFPKPSDFIFRMLDQAGFNPDRPPRLSRPILFEKSW